MVKMEVPPSDPTPQPKVVATGIAGTVTAIIIWLLSAFAHVEIPAEIGAAITTVVGFLIGYITSNR